jgi:2-polyprenyl-3-methyl-5-hydroxy-6-metoxy-1,4-benzoquinol methylase
VLKLLKGVTDIVLSFSVAGLEEIRMPFIEHRGTGKSPATSKFDSMPELWDKTWADQEVPKLDLTKTEHWTWLKQFMPPPAKVLEADCGKGQWVRSLDELGYEAYGVDFTANTIENALKQLPHLNLIVGDLRTMTFEDDFSIG